MTPPPPPPSGDFDHDARTDLFATWREAPLGELLGRGRYGEVFRAGTAAAKRMELGSERSRGSRRQAYREHVVGLLQSLLLLQRVTPHLPWHYGASLSAAPGAFGVTLHMELFETTLPAAAPSVLVAPRCWVQLLFQLLQASAALVQTFGVCHNDAYPRNVLLRRCRRQRVAYELEGRSFVLCVDFLAALTDYGIASGELLGAPLAPEVAASKALPSSSSSSYGGGGGGGGRTTFAFVAPERHILHYEVPPFSRDAYTLLKWAVYGAEELPAAPLNVRAWALLGTNRLDAEAARFAERAALPRFVAGLYDAGRLAAFGLGDVLEPPLRSLSPPEAFCLRADAAKVLLPRALQALEIARREEEQWMTTTTTGGGREER
jgi:hypothetical protein